MHLPVVASITRGHLLILNLFCSTRWDSAASPFAKGAAFVERRNLIGTALGIELILFCQFLGGLHLVSYAFITLDREHLNLSIYVTRSDAEDHLSAYRVVERMSLMIDKFSRLFFWR
mmetsp:Transcript_2306/g.6257  ORF Transcript_2306/g.6257 Transcript_2306/m.6257 type:complete len:117 (-) Transcript_2306:1255-1605(-)